MHANTLLVGLRLYIAYLYKNQVIDYSLDLFTCLLYSCSGTSLECPAVVVSQLCSGPFSIVSLFHSCDIYVFMYTIYIFCIFTKTFIMFITNYAYHSCQRRNPDGNEGSGFDDPQNSLFTLCFAESKECFM